MIQIRIDPDTFAVYVDADYIKIDNLKVVVTDYDTGCTYYVADWGAVDGPFHIWTVPFHPRIADIVKQSPNFGGFVIHIVSNNSIIQTETFLRNPSPSLRFPHFNSPMLDSLGASYVDFFHGSLLKGMDFKGVVVDAGANVGLFTLYAQHMGAYRTYAVEPSPDSFHYLQRNFAQSPHDVIPIRKAFGSTNDPVEFTMCLGSSVGSSETLLAHYPNVPHWNIKSDTLTVDDILRMESQTAWGDTASIKLLKLDIEGSEFKVIESLQPEHFNSIHQFFIEFHADSQPIWDKLVSTNLYHVEYRECTPGRRDVGFIYARKK